MEREDIPGSRTLRLPEDAAGRLDSALARLLGDVSRRRLKEAFREGRVRVDGRRAKADDDARAGAQVRVLGVDPVETTEAPVRVVHEDAHFLVVDKPAGVPAYPLRADEAGTIAGAVRLRHPELVGVGDMPLAPGLAHRLDRETSGLLVFARTQAAFEGLRAAFRAREIDKRYLAVVAGALAGEGEIDVPLARRRKDARRMHPAPDASAPGLRSIWPAITRWRSRGPMAEGTLVEIQLVTGVTHQARVHLAYLGHPIVGDALYGGPPGPRLMLHAARLTLPHPDGPPLTVESPATFP